MNDTEGMCRNKSQGALPKVLDYYGGRAGVEGAAVSRPCPSLSSEWEFDVYLLF